MDFDARTQRLDNRDNTTTQAASERMQLESAQLLGVRSVVRERTVVPHHEIQMPGLKGNDYTIKSGDTISSIAVRMLKLRGEAVSSRNVYEEVGRIIDLNAEKFPWLEKNASKIRPGMKLAVWDRDTGPDPTCKWKEWKDAEPGKTTVAQRCESIFGGKNTQVVIAPGGRAVMTPGSYAFVAPRAFARALEGSHVMAVGGDIIDDGASIQVLHADAKVSRDRRRPQAAPAVPDVLVAVLDDSKMMAAAQASMIDSSGSVPTSGLPEQPPETQVAQIEKDQEGFEDLLARLNREEVIRVAYHKIGGGRH